MKMMPTLVVLVACLLSTSLGAPQLFPFSNLRSYFDHQAKNGPGSLTSAATPELTSIVDTPIFRQPARAEEISKFPKNHLPPNHKSDVLPSLEPPSASAAASPIVNYQPPIPEQVLKAPDAVPPIIYGEEPTQDKANNERKKLQVLPTFVSQIPFTVVSEKYIPYGAILPSKQPQIIQGIPPVSIQNPPIIMLPKAPAQNLQSPIPTSEYINEKTIEKSKEIPIKGNKSPTNSYPKKWQPEKEKEATKIKYPKGEESNMKVDKNIEVLKKELKQMKENQQSIGASSSYPKTLIPVFPKAVPKVPSLGEQVASETGFTDITAGAGGYGIGGGGGGIGGDRVEFQMHGQHGPHSYKFGYDTGKGHNRQFRYEERDNDGHVKGHYGFYNKHGKLQIVSYSAHPEHGFQAEGNYGKHGIA